LYQVDSFTELERLFKQCCEVGDRLKLLRALGYEPPRDFHVSLREASSVVGLPYPTGRHSLIEEVSRGRLPVFHPLPSLPRVLFSDLVGWYEIHGEKTNARPRKRESLCRPLLLPETDWWWQKRQKAFASLCVRHALESGLIERGPCVQCGKVDSDAHHPDYNKPLLITWLCRPHHSSYHSKQKGRRDPTRREELRLARRQQTEQWIVGSDRPLSRDELCRWLHCSPKFVEAEVAKGRLRPHKLSHRMVRFTWDEIDRWLASKAV
jgi:hypothetical protein